MNNLGTDNYTEQQESYEIPVNQSDTELTEDDLSCYTPRELSTKQFLITICKLEDVIDQEILALESQKMPDFQDINTQKIRLLRDIEQRQDELMQFEDYAQEENIISKLEQLKPKLIRNQYLLKLHFDAVADLVELLKARAEALDADGTYKADDCLTQINPQTEAK